MGGALLSTAKKSRLLSGASRSVNWRFCATGVSGSTPQMEGSNGSGMWRRENGMYLQMKL